MNQDLALKYQAFVDGELREAEARQIAQLLEKDAEARALVAELRDTKTLLAGNEPQQPALPESRDFYWSKIQRDIQRLEAEPHGAERAGGWVAAFAGWRRFLAPLAGVAVIAFLAMVAARFYSPEPADYLAEIENLSDESTAYSFRSGNMFVVWTKDTEMASDDSRLNFIDYNEAVAQ
jgi:anti-sigma-K factor RskA